MQGAADLCGVEEVRLAAQVQGRRALENAQKRHLSDLVEVQFKLQSHGGKGRPGRRIGSDEKPDKLYRI